MNSGLNIRVLRPRMFTLAFGILMLFSEILDLSSHAQRASRYVSLKLFYCPGRANRRAIVAVRLTFLDLACYVLSISRYCLDGLLSLFILTRMMLPTSE